MISPITSVATRIGAAIIMQFQSIPLNRLSARSASTRDVPPNDFGQARESPRYPQELIIVPALSAAIEFETNFGTISDELRGSDGVAVASANLFLN
jgi:hypothetical protein